MHKPILDFTYTKLEPIFLTEMKILGAYFPVLVLCVTLLQFVHHRPGSMSPRVMMMMNAVEHNIPTKRLLIACAKRKTQNATTQLSLLRVAAIFNVAVAVWILWSYFPRSIEVNATIYTACDLSGQDQEDTLWSTLNVFVFSHWDRRSIPFQN